MNAQQKQTVRKNLFGIITVIVSAVILLIFLFSTDGIHALMHVSKHLQVPWLLAAFAAVGGTWLLEGFVLNMFCRMVYPNWKFHYSFCLGMVGMLYSALTPFSTGGQPMQIYYMSKLGMNAGGAGSIIAMKTLVYQVVMVAYSLTMVIWKLGFFQSNISNFSFLTIIGLISNGLFIILVFLFCKSEKTTDRILKVVINFMHKIHLCHNPEKRYKSINSELSIFHDSAKIMHRSYKIYFCTAIFTALQIGIGYLIPYFIYRSFGLNAQTIGTIMAAQAFVSMVSAFVPMPGASGGAEGSFYIFFKMFFTGVTIIPAMILWRALTYYLNIIGGCVFTSLANRLPILPTVTPKFLKDEQSDETPNDSEE